MSFQEKWIRAIKGICLLEIMIGLLFIYGQFKYHSEIVFRKETCNSQRIVPAIFPKDLRVLTQHIWTATQCLNDRRTEKKSAVSDNNVVSLPDKISEDIKEYAQFCTYRPSRNTNRKQLEEKQLVMDDESEE